MGRVERNIEITYGSKDLARNPAFQGGWINFGYWKGLLKAGKVSSRQDRIGASQSLYRCLWRRLPITDDDEVLEVGCGRGLGCALALLRFHPKRITGLDFSQDQVKRARAINRRLLESGPCLSFVQGRADRMPFKDGDFSRLYSVEAAQHFGSVAKFANESWRVLKPNGQIALTTFFAADSSALAPLEAMLPTIRKRIDRIIPIGDCLNAFRRAGFQNIACASIGKHVFEGFDR